MRVVFCPEESDVMTFNDKVMGVFEGRGDFDRFAGSLDLVDGTEVEMLHGAAGRRCLQSVKQSVEGFLDAVLGDMESAMMEIYLQAVERGAVVFAIPATAENRMEIVEAAVRHGGKHIAHFGQIVTESFEHLTGDPPP